MEIILIYVFILVALEYFESSWQKESTLGGMIQKAYSFYDRNIFIFFAMHPGLYFLLFVMLLTHNYSFWFLFPILIKATDIIFKISIIQKIENDTLGTEYKILFSQPIPKYMFYIPVILYPTFLYFGLTL